MLALAVAAIAVLTSCSQIAGQVPHVELTTLARNPERFDGKEVVVSGLVGINEGRYMVLSGSGARAHRELMYIALDPGLANNADEVTRKYLTWPEPYVVLTARGRFVVASRAGFGHLNKARFKLEVHKVIAVEHYKPR